MTRPLPARRRPPSAPAFGPGAVRGYSLIELMIGLVLGLVAVGALFTVYMSSRTNYRRDEQIAQVQENARFALDAITRDLQNGGYWGGVINSPDIQSNLTFVQGTKALVPVASDCGPAGVNTSWLFDFTRAFYFRNQANDTASPQASFQCLANTPSLVGQIATDSDIFAVKRVATQPAATGTNGTLSFDRSALSLVTSSNGGTSTVGLVLQPAAKTALALSTLTCTTATDTATACQPQGGTVVGYRLLPSVYYVRKFTRTAGDGVPSLCRRVLAIPVTATGTTDNPYTDECVASGVENMQLEWGVGTSAAPDLVDHYTSAPLATDFTGNLVNTARVYLLMRSASAQVGSGRNAVVDDPRTYVMTPNDYSSGPDNRLTAGAAAGSDSFYRKLYTVTIQLKNARNKVSN